MPKQRLEPGLPGAIVEQSNEVWAINGELHAGVNIALSPEQFEQYREGRRCLRCHALQEEPFPKECIEPFCSFRIRDDQLRYLENEHRGTHRYGPSDDEYDDEAEIWTPNGGIRVPKSISTKE